MDIEAYNIIRILVVLISGISIYFGYRLFSIVTERQGKLKIEDKDTALELSDVGPGVFFSFFGSAVLIGVLITQPYSENTITDLNGNVTTFLRSPASANSINSDIQFFFDDVCVSSEKLEIFNDAKHISLMLLDMKIDAPHGEVDSELKKSINALLGNLDSSNYFKVVYGNLYSNIDAYNFVNSLLILIPLKNPC